MNKSYQPEESFFTSQDEADYQDGSRAAFGPMTPYEAIRYSGPGEIPAAWVAHRKMKEAMLAMKKRPGLGQPFRQEWIDARKPWWWRPAPKRRELYKD